MDESDNTCAVCGEYGRLRCADCRRAFCVEHLERRFDLGYFFLCAACAAQRQAREHAPAPKIGRRRRKAPGA